MENVFNFREQLIEEYSTFSRSFARIDATDIRGIGHRDTHVRLLERRGIVDAVSGHTHQIAIGFNALTTCDRPPASDTR